MEANTSVDAETLEMIPRMLPAHAPPRSRATWSVWRPPIGAVQCSAHGQRACASATVVAGVVGLLLWS